MLKVKAGVLPYTLGISVIVSAILAAIILLGYYYRLEDRSRQIQTNLIYNLRSAEQLALSNPNQFEYFEPTLFDLYRNGEDTVVITKLPWGFFDYFHVRSVHSRFARDSYFSLGCKPDSIMYSGLYLYDDRRPLSVVGDTRISGILYLPQSGVQSAFVDRQGYQNDSLFYGTRKVSGDTMPDLFEDYLQGWDVLDDFTARAETTGYSIAHSFRNDTLIKITGAKIEVSDTLEGKVYIEADEVTFTSTAKTKDILVKANTIRFENGFEGSGQFLASDSLLLESSSLIFPSVAFLQNEKSVGFVELNGSSVVEGVLGISGDPQLYSQRILNIEDGAEVRGAVYCDGYLELYGKIAGHASVRKTLVRTQNAVYENYLFNAEIDGNDFPRDMVVPNIWLTSNKKEVFQWLR